MIPSWLLNYRQRGSMREIHLGSHTLKSHGIKVAKNHKFDWFALIGLLILVLAIRTVRPFYRFVGKEMMTDLRYPFKTNTVPPWALPIISIVLPAAIIVAFYIHKRDIYDLHHAILGLLFAVLTTALITDALKDAVGRPRPDFFWRCFPDGKEVYDKVTGNVICHGEKKVLNDGHKSFPSGHTSWCFAGLSYLALYLSGKIKCFDRKGHVAKLCIVFFPLLLASLIGISRVDDYKHHWEDVFAGGILGVVVATFCYLQFFPAPYHSDGWGPYAYFQMLEDNQNSSNLTPTVNQRIQGTSIVALSGIHSSSSPADNASFGRV
ncbi:lipid phosphate phosphatase 2-like isoform X1 [Curcuma longa]|uniref:lipid phosphate phosphatase 2-like isoform X1 n=2 Tax=Curcuma longa TaxID=136217 RepID=UPI003D9E3258